VERYDGCSGEEGDEEDREEEDGEEEEVASDEPRRTDVRFFGTKSNEAAVRHPGRRSFFIWRATGRAAPFRRPSAMAMRVS